jgi:hypothetical protein
MVRACKYEVSIGVQRVIDAFNQHKELIKGFSEDAFTQVILQMDAFAMQGP